jgi:predicted transcriptional regulator
MAKVKNTPKVTLQDLQNLRAELEQKAAKIQTELAEKTYSINFESIANLTKVINHVNKDVTWTSKNAALLVNLSDSLKTEKSRLLLAETAAKAELRINGTEVDAASLSTVNLRQVDVNTLYQSLLAVQSTGIESARTYVKLLTNIGAQITEAMKQLAESNKEIQELHVELAELDAKIMQEGTPTEPELISNEAI